MTPGDPFDPTTWTADDYEYRIYADDKLSLYAVVDAIDYSYLVRWRWIKHYSRGRTKVYLKRTMHEGTRIDRVQKTLFLHQAIMQRSGLVRPSPFHVLPDHINGNSLDCRRDNLRWATYLMNRMNINGAAACQSGT